MKAKIISLIAMALCGNELPAAVAQDKTDVVFNFDNEESGNFRQVDIFYTN
jgi:hypothetical protein